MQGNKHKLEMASAMTIFGTIGIVRRYIPFPSSVISLVRGFVGTLFLLGLLLSRGEKLNRQAIRENAVLLVLSGILLGFNWIFLFESYQYTYVSVATMCYYMAPVMVIMLSPIIFHEALTLKKGLCAFTAVAGMFLVSGILDTGLTGVRGMLFGFAAALMYAGIVIVNKMIKGLNGSERTLLQLGIATIALLPYVLLTENLSELTFTPFIIAMLAIAGIVHTGFAYVLYFGSMAHIPTQTVAILSYLDPSVAVILSVLVLKETLSPLAFVGVVMVLGAMMVSELELKHRHR